MKGRMVERNSNSLIKEKEGEEEEEEKEVEKGEEKRGSKAQKQIE